ncbi:MAG: OsmC family protein, partial [Proteobacteria bacterium]|nr:OsmC family protein [Pseudomonadota bacterium]
YDLLLASLGSCTNMTLRMYAARKGWPLEKVTVTLATERIYAKDCEACETATGKVDRIDRVIELEGPLSDEQKARLLEIADMCPISRTLTSEVVIRSRLEA